jgi:hypothetical protein
MQAKLRVAVFVVWILVLSGLFASGSALTEKELWEKEYGDDYRLQPLDPPVILEHGGPDPGGYYYIDSNDPAFNAPVFSWTDISGYGTPVTLDDDDNQGPFPIGFDFTFYGNTFTQFNICSNGFISFTSTSTRYANDPIPDTDDPNDLLAIFWDDLNPENGGQVYYYSDTTTNQLIVSYNGVPHYSDIGALYFQVLLNGDDSSIVYHYGVMNDAGHGNNGSTVGIENSDGTIGTEYRYYQPGITDSMAVYFGFDAPNLPDHDVSPSNFINFPLYGEVGDEFAVEARFINQGVYSESFPVRLIVNHDGNEVYNQTEQVTDLDPETFIDITFPGFTPNQNGIHDFFAISELVGDENPANDTIRASFRAYGSVYRENFELTDGTFVGNYDWQWGEPTSGPNGAHSGDKLWATNLAGNYSESMLAHLVSPVFGISSDAFLGIWHWYDIETFWDGGNVKITTDGGATWTVITPDGGYDGVGNSSNPLSGEEIFTGRGNTRWQFETFDLSAYDGMFVIFRFDFGSDGSITFPGWYIDDFTIYGGGAAGVGYIAGTVSDLASGLPIEGALVEGGTARDSTDASGNYVLELTAGSYSVTASAPYHNSQTFDDLTVVEAETTFQDFTLAAPIIQVDTTPITASVAIGDTAVFTRNMANTGNGDLEFTVSISIGDRIMNVRPEIRPANNVVRNNIPLYGNAEYSPTYTPGNLPTILEFGDELFRFDVESPTYDSRILGIEFDGVHFWFTGANDLVTHKLHKFDRDGNLVQIFVQGTTTTWGWRDLAWDGEYLYASDENELAKIDPVSGQKVEELPMPTAFNPPLRALAYDPAADHFWAANWASAIIEFDRTGAVINTYANNLSAYGMAWDDVSDGGPYLWVFSQDGAPATLISQFSPSSGQYTGVSFYAVDSSGSDALAGGLCFTAEWDPSLGILGCVLQDNPDMAVGYEVTPASQWLIVDPMSGLLAPAENVDLSVMVDFRGDDIVPDTTYEASIMVLNNTPDTPEIPVTIDVLTGIDEEVTNLPRQVALYQNYPNPFNASTEIKFGLPEQSDVTIEVYNILGQKTATLANGLFPAGYHSVNWNAGNVASGVYYYRLTATGKVMIKKMMLLK